MSSVPDPRDPRGYRELPGTGHDLEAAIPERVLAAAATALDLPDSANLSRLPCYVVVWQETDGELTAEPIDAACPVARRRAAALVEADAQRTVWVLDLWDDEPELVALPS